MPDFDGNGPLKQGRVIGALQARLSKLRTKGRGSKKPGPQQDCRWITGI